MGLLFRSVAYSSWHGTIAEVPRWDVRVWWLQIVVVWYRVSCEEVIRAICPLCLLTPICVEFLLSNSQHYALKSSIVYSLFWFVTDRFQSTFTCSCSVSALKFFAETSYYATLWSIVFKVSFVRNLIIFYLPLKEQFTLKMKIQSLFNPLNAVSKPIWPFFLLMSWFLFQ